jgi:hypothetical protein
MFEFIAAIWIVLHGPGGFEININPKRVTSMRSGIAGQKNKFIHEDAKCVLNMDDGKFISVIETCDQVRQALKDIPE